MTFPTPENMYDADTMAHVNRRRAHMKQSCPRHGDADLEFYKELMVKGSADTDPWTLSATALYNDGCMVSVYLNTDQEYRFED